MPINPLLSLQTQSLDTATPVRNLIDMRQQKEQLDLQRSQNERQERMMDLREQQVSADIIQQRYEQMEKADKRRTRNVALASAQLKRVLENDGPEAAQQWLQNNQEGNGRFNLPSQDTEEAMSMLESGNVDQLRTGLSNNIYIGESLGLIETPDQPKEFEPIYDDQGNVIAQRETRTGREYESPRAGEGDDFSARNVLLPSGEKVSGRTTEQGELQIKGPEGGWHPAPRDAQIISTSLQGFEGLKSSDTNAIHRQAASLYGGMYDPRTGQFQGLDKDSAQDALALSERASRIYSEGQGRVSHADAVSQAAREFGIDVTNIEGGAQPGGASTQALEDEPKVIRYDAEGNRIE